MAISIIFKLRDNFVLMMWLVVIDQSMQLAYPRFFHMDRKDIKKIQIHNFEKNIRVKFDELKVRMKS